MKKILRMSLMSALIISTFAPIATKTIWASEIDTNSTEAVAYSLGAKKNKGGLTIIIDWLKGH